MSKQKKQKAEKSKEPDDVRQIHDLFREIWDGEKRGDPSSAIAACASDIVAYSAFLGGPEFWTVEIVGLDGVLKHNTPEETLREWHAKWAKPDADRRGEEVLHVDVKDNRAIALTQKWKMHSDSKAREDILTQFQEVVLLSKLNGKWKMTNSIVGVNFRQQVNRWGEER